MSENNEPLSNEKKEEEIEYKWTSDHENILVDWADKAMCYRWLHSKNYEKYRKLNTWFTIPVIIMSTLTGTANFAQERVPPDMRGYYSMVVGGVNIVAGVVTTIQNFLKIGELNEAHRIASISWDKFYRKIKVELAKPPIERQSVDIYIKHCTEEFDRLMETSPEIDQKIIMLFKETFEGVRAPTPGTLRHKIYKLRTFFNPELENKTYIQFDTSGNQILSDKQKAFKDLKKPEICDSLESVKSIVYKPPPMNTRLISNEYSSNLSELVKRKTANDSKEKKINDFVNSFTQKYNRQPTEEEIIENLENEQENITKNVVSTWLSKKKPNLQKSIQMVQTNIKMPKEHGDNMV
jgi:hypothetical protein